jgi:Lsr2
MWLRFAASENAAGGRLASCSYSVMRLGIHLRRGKGDTQVAQKISVTFACDYDSREIPEGEHLTRAFSLDGRDYEIDLCEKHSQKFDEVLQRFADKARKVTNRVGKPKRRTTAHRQRSAEIRAWAKQSGMDVSDRGRIPANVIAKYEANH